MNANYPNIPDPNWIRKQTTVIGGEALIMGLTRVQADELVRFANDRGIAGSGDDQIKVELEHPLSPDERRRLSNRFQFHDGSVEVYLGHTVDCHVSLWNALGITD